MNISINGVTTPALLDTGSTVSTISKSFYTAHFSSIEIQPITHMLQIECADGQLLPYEGFISVNVQFCGTGMVDEYNSIPEAIFLIVPDSPYNSKVPVLVGTNVLSVLLDNTLSKFGTNFLQSAQLVTPLYLSFRCMHLREKELTRRKYKLAVVKCATLKPVTIVPNSSNFIPCYLDRQLDYPDSCVMFQSTVGSKLPSDLDITPSIIPYRYRNTGIVQVHVTNVSTKTVTIQPNALVCELQPVTVENIREERVEPAVDFDVTEQVDVCTEGLSDVEISQGRTMLWKYKSVFSMHEDDVGHTDLVRHHIELNNERPFKQRHRRIPPSMYQEVRDHLQHLLASGIIRRSHSPWASNIVLCRKKDGSLRMCVDYRELNQRTIKDSYALPRVDEILESLAGNRYFSVIDMKSGYHNVDVHEPHKERTAFTVGPLGFYEYNRMPFGLTNSPATYQRLMEQCLGDLNTQICYIYLDDVIIFSRTFEEHVERLERVLDKILHAGFKLSPKKCHFFKRRVRYVGHIVSEKGIEPDPDKIVKVSNWETPTTPEAVRKFLGFVGYYRRFIPDFSKIARPLSDLMPTPHKSKSKSKVKQKPWEWGPAQEHAFAELKRHLTSPPILGYPDFDYPFELHIDASLQGLGAVLYQQQCNVKRVISYASRGLTKSEKNYPAHKLEFLALKWSVCDKFCDYLVRNKFTVFTDNNPVTYVMTSAKLDATTQRWAANLAAFQFDLIYRKGSSNADADAMSRMPPSSTEDKSEMIASDVVKVLCQMTNCSGFVECMTMSTSVVDVFDEHEPIPSVNLRMKQIQDPEIRWIVPWVKRRCRPQKSDVPVGYTLARCFEHLRFEDGILYRVTDLEGTLRRQIVLPRSLVTKVMEMVHDKMGHLGRDKTLGLVQDRFYWSGMSKEVENYIRSCKRCLLRKKPAERAPLVNITTTQPLEVVCLDFLSLETSKGGLSNILVMTDHFTKYAVAVPTRNQTAHTTAEVFLNHFVHHYGLPKRIHTDQGPNFESRLMQELCQITGIEKSHTTPYHPMGNGLCERTNRTILNLLGTLEDCQKQNWKAHLASLVHAYNSTKQDSTGFSPYFLMFGREPRLPVDLAFGIGSSGSKSLTSYVGNLKKRLKEAYNIATTRISKSQEKQKESYDSKVRGGVPLVGDRVLVKIVAFDGRHKLSNVWEDEPYVIMDQPNVGIPVFKVKKENGTGKVRTLHRNLLLPIGYITPKV